jgi:hypothetical protein
MQPVIQNIGATSLNAWNAASLKGAVGVEVATPFRDVLSQGYTPAMQGLFSLAAFRALEATLQPNALLGRKVAIYGAGSFGLALAAPLSEAGADIIIYSAPEAPTALARALGILEPQGKSVENFFHASLPIFDELIKAGAPIRRDRVVYYYQELATDFVEQLKSMPDSNYRVESTNLFGCRFKLSFDGYIMSGTSMRDFYMGILAKRGATFVEQEMRELIPVPGHLTFSALGMGRAKIQGQHSVDLPGNRGQMICVEGTDVVKLLNSFPELDDAGSVGIPTSAGSVNIVLHYRNPAAREEPFLVIGATKEPGNGSALPRKADSEFLNEGIRKLWPALGEYLQAYSESQDLDIAADRLNFSEYVCVRPGGGETSFKIHEVDGCTEIVCAGGMGNSLAPAAALKAISLAQKTSRTNT